jgi:hypothetical protein
VPNLPVELQGECVKEKAREMMQLQEIRNQMWIVDNGEPLRKAKESEVRRWATLRIIETLQAEKSSTPLSKLSTV